MISGDILFIRGHSYMSRLICRFQRSNFSHVALAMDEEHIIESTTFAKIQVNKLSHDQYKLMRVDLTEEQKKLVVEKALNYVGKRYDYWGVIKWLFRLLTRPQKYLLRSSKRYYCSGLVDRIFQDAGIDLFPNRKAGDVMPVELESSPLLYEVEEKIKGLRINLL